ncbi:putative metal-dependent hydrolase of the TIM-barrel fold protein [Ceratocystis platani]|uniref:Putative metal-dependent hydrolase of the TIM-barrel fold protein n=1 Tax=Ceratocystis fimbriata f. sp. platani TaxID=88771 RepID=A0A0F8DBF9_CERFI|nr:putative metal-dependent hydrolase of the TIM-barrel fold protein [Ceratocystis platani]
MAYPIIDSHIHLWPESAVSTYPWATTQPSLAKCLSITEYREASLSLDRLRGFILVEAARTYDLSAGEAGWAGPLDEVAWFRRVVEETASAAEGVNPGDARLCVGIVPWAPMPSGSQALEKYLSLAEERAGPKTWSLVKGFRFLLQDQDLGLAISDGFIDALKLLGRKGYVFEVGVDEHRRGKKQLDEVLEMIAKAHEGVADEEKVAFVINNLAKPDLHIVNPADKKFQAWRTSMYGLSLCAKTYVQVSGLFSEMPASIRGQDSNDVFMAVFPWLSVVLATFGADRLIFASDWPECTKEDDGASWVKWKEVVERLCYMATLSQADQAMIFGGTAKKAFNLDVDLEEI